MNQFSVLTAGTDQAAGSPWTMIILVVVMIALFYFMSIRPNQKRQKKEREMRGNLKVGDGVTTIGGIVGRVVSIKDDTFVLETGSDRAKIRFQKGAIQEVEPLDLEDKN